MTQTRVDRFLSSPQRVDVGMIGGEAGRDLGTLGNGPVAGDQDIDVPGSHNGAGRATEKVRGPVLHRDKVRLGPGEAGHGNAWRGPRPPVLSS